MDESKILKMTITIRKHSFNKKFEFRPKEAVILTYSDEDEDCWLGRK